MRSLEKLYGGAWEVRTVSEAVATLLDAYTQSQAGVDYFSVSIDHQRVPSG